MKKESNYNYRNVFPFYNLTFTIIPSGTTALLYSSSSKALFKIVTSGYRPIKSKSLTIQHQCGSLNMGHC